MIENFWTMTCRRLLVFKVNTFIQTVASFHNPEWINQVVHGNNNRLQSFNQEAKNTRSIWTSSPRWTGKQWWDLLARTVFQNESRILNRKKLSCCHTSSVLTCKWGSSGNALRDKMSNLHLQTTRSRQRTVVEGKQQSCWCTASSSLSWQTTCVARCVWENDDTDHEFSLNSAALSFWATEFEFIAVLNIHLEILSWRHGHDSTRNLSSFS